MTTPPTQSLLHPLAPAPNAGLSRDAGLSPSAGLSQASLATKKTQGQPEATRRAVGLGLLRGPLPLEVPTLWEVSPDRTPRVLFDPLTRRQSILLQEIEAERAEVNRELLLADELRRAEGAGLGLDFSSNDALVASIKRLRATDETAFVKWNTDAAARYAPLTGKLQRLTDQMLLVWPSALVGDWGAVVGQGVEWAHGEVEWPSLRHDTSRALHRRVEMAMDWPQEVMDALKAHILAATKQGAAALTQDEAGN